MCVLPARKGQTHSALASYVGSLFPETNCEFVQSYECERGGSGGTDTHVHEDGAGARSVTKETVMAYAETVMRVRDADSETELLIERHDGSAEDGAVVEFQVTLGYGGSLAAQHRGYVRLTAEHYHRLAEYLGAHASDLRAVEWAAERDALRADLAEALDEWAAGHDGVHRDDIVAALRARHGL